MPALLEPLLNRIRDYNLLGLTLKEAGPSIVLRPFMVMNPSEGLDQLIYQLGHWLVYVPMNLGLGKGIDALTKAVVPEAVAKAGQAAVHPDAQLWSHLGKAAFLYANMTGYMLGAKAMRNAIVARNTQTTDFVGMVGLKGSDYTEDPAKVDAYAKQEMGRFKWLYGSGVGVGTSLLAGALLAAKQNLPVPKLLQSFQQHLGLPEGNYLKLTNTAAMPFLILPVYIGELLHTRDKVEKTETWVSMATFPLALTVLPKTVGRFIDNTFKGRTNLPLVGSGANAAFLADTLSGALFCMAVPAAINLATRRWKARQMGLLSVPIQAATTEPAPLTTTPTLPPATPPAATMPSPFPPPLVPVAYARQPAVPRPPALQWDATRRSWQVPYPSTRLG